MTLDEIGCMLRAKQKQQILVLSIALSLSVSVRQAFMSFLFSVCSCFPSSLIGEGEVVFLLCDRVREGVYITLLLVDGKTFKNIRCFSRSCF